MDIKIFNNEQDWINTTVEFIESLHPHTIGLSGGSTPIPIYQALAKTPIKDCEFFQVDERYVPASDPDSNQKMIRETLAPPNFHFFDTSLPIPRALTKYADELPPRLNLCVLGVGPDGHTASLFPDSPDFSTPTAHTQTSEFPVKDRLTLTFPTLQSAKTLLILLKHKPQILHALTQSPATPSPESYPLTDTYPITKLLNHPSLHILALD